MELPAQTLHDFVLNLLTDQQALAAFQSDPQAALSGAGLSDISASEVHEIVPLVMDYVPMSDAGGIGAAMSSLQQASPLSGQAAAVDQLQRLAHAFSISSTGDGFTGVADYSNPAFGGAHAAGSFTGSVTDGVAGGETVTSPLGGELFSGAVAPDGQFEFGSSYAAGPLSTQGGAHLAGSQTGGVAGTAGLAAPHAEGSVSGYVHPNGDFRADTQLASDALDSQTWATIRGNLTDGAAAGGGASTPLGDGAVTGSFTTGGHVQQNAHLASGIFGTSADTGLTGSLSDGLAGSGAVNSPLGDGAVAFTGATGGIDAVGQYTTPLGDGDFSLSVPGLDDLSVHSLDQSFSDGSNTVASALADPGSGLSRNPAAALGALFGNAPVPELHFTPAENPLGGLPTPNLGDVLPQAPVAPEPSQDPAGSAAAKVGDAVDHATSQVTPDAGNDLATQAQQGASGVAGQLSDSVHNTLDTVTSGLHSATSGLTPGSGGDAAQSVQSTVDSVTGDSVTGDSSQSTASQSPVGDSDAGSSSGAGQLTDALEHNAVTDALHDVGDSLHLHL